MYVLYALLTNIFALFVFVDYHLNVCLDKFAGDERVENRYFDHIVGKYLLLHTCYLRVTYRYLRVQNYHCRR